MLSKKAKYALKAMLFIAKSSEEKVQTNDISNGEKIPRKFLEAIMVELRNKAFIFSNRGKNGGFKLAKPLNEITVGAIVRAIDGPLAPIPCVSKLYYQPCEECVEESTCEIKSVMQKVRDATSEILDNTTLEDLKNGKTF